MRRCLAVVVALAFLGLAAPDGGTAVRIAFDEERDCLQPMPRWVEPVRGRGVVLDLLVLLDGVSLADGQQAVRDARRAYDPVGISLRPRFARVTIPADGAAEGYDGKRYPTASTDRVMAAAKAAVRGRPPAGIEAVYLLTVKDLYFGADAPDDGGRAYGVAGMADCIGGVALRHRAFAIGERLSIGNSDGPIRSAQRLPGKILAHEVAHLLGAHHHYANCAEAAPAAATDRSTDACTLMFNDVSLVSLRLSMANRAVVRGHAVTHSR